MKLEKYNLLKIREDYQNLIYVDQNFNNCMEAIKINEESLKFIKWKRIKNRMASEELEKLCIEGVKYQGL
ncbi:DUF4116 domain-containing protein, partial [Clostridioides difficile]